MLSNSLIAVMIGGADEENAAGLHRGAEDLDAVQAAERRVVVGLVEFGLNGAQGFLGHLARIGQEVVGVGVVAVAGIHRLADRGGGHIGSRAVVEGDFVHRESSMADIL